MPQINDFYQQNTYKKFLWPASIPFHRKAKNKIVQAESARYTFLLIFTAISSMSHCL